MNLDSITVDLQFLAGSGRTFNVEERASIQSALHMLKAEQGFARVQLWGKIFGQKTDYIIAQGIYQSGDKPLSKDGKPVIVPYFDSHVQMPKKSFRLSADGVAWLPLLPAEASLVARVTEWEEASRKNGISFLPLSGEPGKKLPYSVQIELPPLPAGAKAEPAEGEEAEESEATEGKEAEPKPTGPRYKEEARTITEEERLAILVESIDSDCAVVPRGAFVMNAAHQVVLNTAFGGLKCDEATKLSSFFHLRPVDKLRKQTKFALSELDKTIEFLDPLNEDFPSGCWSLVSEPLTSQVMLRSLIWPGYYAYHVWDSRSFGSLYMGYGNKNYDLAFML